MSKKYHVRTNGVFFRDFDDEQAMRMFIGKSFRVNGPSTSGSIPKTTSPSRLSGLMPRSKRVCTRGLGTLTVAIWR